ncbi:hypothetical protein [Psychrobacillus sp. BL-248-WT-3]|uniref:hypothetical protein n=1 Tax=Psychrobacillus sp. BL-248-WT-3 TaxID=2725306 RepID=UPI00146C2D16|nr:hypothetical protein [Psychrobacillus sp. BL-248-WT-3]NME07810.1 hypothetical protein [Psychrobacillus sp. BL-248-WT-3]
MKKRNEIFFGLTIIALVIAVLSFIDPVDNKDVTPTNQDDVTDLEKENEHLKQDIKGLEDSLFESKKYIFDSNLAKDYFSDPETEILYKEIEETKYVIVYIDGHGNHLYVSSKEPWYEILLTIPTLEPDDGITWDYIGMGNSFDDKGITNHFLGGIITNNEIKDVHVSFNGEVYEADIFKINENMYGWYSIYKKSSGLDENTLKIQALDEDGFIMWQKTIR